MKFINKEPRTTFPIPGWAKNLRHDESSELKYSIESCSKQNMKNNLCLSLWIILL